MFVSGGLGDPKVSPGVTLGVADGLLVNIPVLGTDRLTWGATMKDMTRRTVMSDPSTKTVVIGKSVTAFIRGVIEAISLRRDGLWSDFIILEKLRKKVCIKSYQNRHRWAGRVDQGEREKVV